MSLASREHDSGAPGVDVLRGQRSTVPGMLDQIHKSLNTAKQHTGTTCFTEMATFKQSTTNIITGTVI